ncbi:MAG: hypothetical protein JW932_04470 [Deltaproteobacteria bacterium]|nr:hypothetical protein [Deltaproteobacteria bacterium]
MKACPTEAIRIRDGLAHIEGECVWICPKRAIKAIIIGEKTADPDRYAMISSSPACYAQFGRGISLNPVLLA